MFECSDMPLSPTATRELLEQLEHFPKKKLGQNFLVDGNIVRKSIELAELGADSCVVEIGPGLGTLTEAILNSGASLWTMIPLRVTWLDTQARNFSRTRRALGVMRSHALRSYPRMLPV